MSLTFGGAFADAGALWRANRDLLVRVAGVFAFLPVLALQLFVPVPDLRDVADDALWEAAMRWYAANGHWIALAMAVQFFGSATILAMLLDPARPPVGAAIARVARLLPALAIGIMGTGALVAAGTMLFFVPGMYAIGRCYLVWAVLVAEPGRGPFDGFAEALRRTRGHGWQLFAVTMTVLLPAYFAVELLTAAGAGAGPVGKAVAALLIAATSMAAGIAQLLLQAAAYRGLRQGI